MNEIKNIPDYMLKLIEGYSTYNKASIRYWTALAVISIIIIIPTETANGSITLPFEIGSFKKADFYPLGLIFLSLLVICFGAAFSQTFRTANLLYKSVNDLKNKYVVSEKIHLQDIIDGMIYPSLTRVAPLAQLLQGEFQFFPEVEKISKFRKRLSLSYYVLLKGIAVSVMYFLPAFALYEAFYNGILIPQGSRVLNIPVFAYYTLLLSSALILAQLLYEDLRFIGRVLKRLSGGRSAEK
jgi:hypothetical protein